MITSFVFLSGDLVTSHDYQMVVLRNLSRENSSP